MKTHTLNDVAALAHGRCVNGDTFCGIFGDPEALADLARLLQARHLMEPLDDEPMEAAPSVDMEFSFEDLSRFDEGLVGDPIRRQAMADFLDRNDLLRLPDLADPPTVDPGSTTELGTAKGAHDTETSLDEKKPPSPPTTDGPA